MSSKRDALFRRLSGPPTDADAAASELLAHPEWLASDPPTELTEALAASGYEAETAVFRLARAWRGAALGGALMAAFQSATGTDVRDHAAWLIKHLPDVSIWPGIARYASSTDETQQTRRYMLEALDNLAFGGAIGWDEMHQLVDRLWRDPQPGVRDTVVGLLMSLPPSDETIARLNVLLGDDDPRVMASASNALIILDPAPELLDLDRLATFAHDTDPLIRNSAQRLIDHFANAG